MVIRGWDGPVSRVPFPPAVPGQWVPAPHLLAHPSRRQMIEHGCGEEMKDQGLWPNHDSTRMVNVFRCLKCNDFIRIYVPESELVRSPNGTVQQVE